MKKIILNKDWIPTYYCKIHHCYDCQICEMEGYKTPIIEKKESFYGGDRLILTTKATLKYYQQRILELEKSIVL